MPPKTQPPAKTQPGRSVKKVSYQAQTIDQVNLTHARHIAIIYKIPYYSKLQLDELIPAIREKMLLVRQCPSCENAQCDPDQHIFPASVPHAEGEVSGSESDTEHPPGDQERGSPDSRVLKDLNKSVNPVIVGCRSRKTSRRFSTVCRARPALLALLLIQTCLGMVPPGQLRRFL